MDEQTKTYIALGAATAANCVPCFEHYFSTAEKLGIPTEDIEETVEIASKVRGGAHMVMKDSIRGIIKSNGSQREKCSSGTPKCCG
ncbi:hypothetical protein D1AOALGA4SA_4057 [Olavius algarvensis Delta 1 endosymbiont]|nr:hypothetical protein D1AOALGA4SA_4057 [Olavius algarvensis Delta 1 endosymbiont]